MDILNNLKSAQFSGSGDGVGVVGVVGVGGVGGVGGKSASALVVASVGAP